MVLRGTHESAGPEGMVRTNVNVLRVNSIHALRGSLSRRSEISPMDVCLCRVGTTRYLVLDCEGFPDFACFFVLDTGSCLGHNMIIGADFAVLRILLTFVTLLRVGMKGPGLGWVSAGGIALTIGPPRNGDVVSTRSQTFLFGRSLRSVHLRCDTRAGCTAL